MMSLLSKSFIILICFLAISRAESEDVDGDVDGFPVEEIDIDQGLDKDDAPTLDEEVSNVIHQET